MIKIENCEICSICHEDFAQSASFVALHASECRCLGSSTKTHPLHDPCYQELSRSAFSLSCPTCRNPIDPVRVKIVHNETEIYADTTTKTHIRASSSDLAKTTLAVVLVTAIPFVAISTFWQMPLVPTIAFSSLFFAFYIGSVRLS